MIWVTWRQFRGTVLAGVLLPLIMASIVIVVSVVSGGITPFATFFSCFGLSTTRCLSESVVTSTFLITLALPVLLGLFVGVTVFSRDIERGTHVLGLTQAVSRRRWYWTRILVVFVPVVASVLVLGVSLYWARYQSFSGTFAVAGAFTSRLDYPDFGAVGIVPAGYTALALVLGSSFALLLRHTIGAMVAALVVMIGVLVLFPTQIREQYASPEIERVELEDMSQGSYATYSNSLSDTFYPSWLVGSDYIDGDGNTVDVDSDTCRDDGSNWPQPVPDETNAQFYDRVDTYVAEADRARTDCLRALGIDHFENRVHSDRLFWRFQWTEVALCLGLAAILAWASTVSVRRLTPR